MSEFRWRLADQERDGQGALFGVDGLLGPQRGTGRLSGLEFLHVAAKRILNEVPASSRMPFRWTINAYRGCSHACVYCLAGDTPILMADGRTRPIADIGVGDRVYGTERRGAYRRYRPAEVLAHWRTVEPAYHITLRDGTTITASGDHRFLTDRGWKHVTGAAAGTRQRPYLTADSELLGVDGVAVNSDADLRVASVEPLGIELPMYDITTTTGDFVANGVISHNCFARPTHAYLGLNIGEDFDRRIVVKINAVERLRAELADPRWTNEPVAMGTNTDPYQRCEGKYRLTRGVLEALTERGTPFSILTKSPLVLRDLDVLTEAARTRDVTVNFSVGTLDERVWRATEPGTPHPRRRVAAMHELANAGIRTGALVAPVLPGLSDSPDQLREVGAAIEASGGRILGVLPLHLRPGVREHFLGWLAGHDPALHADYLRRYAGHAYAPRSYAEHLRRLVDDASGKTRGPASPVRHTSEPPGG